jgi:hypothetical protein
MILPNEAILTPAPKKRNRFPRPHRTQARQTLKPIHPSGSVRQRPGETGKQRFYRTNPFLPRTRTNQTSFLARPEPNLTLRSNSPSSSPAEAARSSNSFTERTHSCPEPKQTEPLSSPAPNPISPFAQTPIHPSGSPSATRRGRPEQQRFYRTNPFSPRSPKKRNHFPHPPRTQSRPSLKLSIRPCGSPSASPPARPPGAATILPNEPILAREPKGTKPLSSRASNPISPFAQTPHPPEWLPSSSPAETVGGFFGLLGENHFPHPRRTQSRLSLKPPSARVAPQPPAPPRPPGAATILPNEPILAREPKKTKPLSSPASNPISPLAQTPHPPEWLPSSSPAETARSSNDFTERTHSRRETEETKPLSSHAPNPISPFAQTPHPPRVAPHPPAPPRPPGAATILPNEPILAREPEETKPLSSPVSNPISTPSLKPIHPGGPPSATAPAKPAKTTNRRTNPFPARARRSRPPRDLRTQSRIHSPK